MCKRMDIAKMFGLPKNHKCENCGNELTMHTSFPFYDDTNYIKDGYTFDLYCNDCYHINIFKLELDVSLSNIVNNEHEWCDHDEESDK